MNNFFDDDIRNALINDTLFDFKQGGKILFNGVCPSCGHRECFVSLDEPYRVSCNRKNNCGWSESTRNLYPDIFANIADKFIDSTNPNAAAEAYMTEVRGFDINKLQGMFFQSTIKNKYKNEYYAAIKIIVNQSCYYTRVINASDVKKNGAKAKIVGDYKNLGWMPPCQELQAGDEVYITEGIFKSMALMMIGKKTISALSSSNLPRDIIKANAKKNIVWILAEDSDPAGIKAAEKFKAEIEEMGEICRVCFPNYGEDWDDVYVANKLDKQYLSDSFYRGMSLLAKTASEKAFLLYSKTKKSEDIFTYDKSMWKYSYESPCDDEKADFLKQFNYPKNGHWDIDIATYETLLGEFKKGVTMKMLSAAVINFLYMEEDFLTQSRVNTFGVEFHNNTPSMLVSAEGSIYESPQTFNRTMLAKTGLVGFNGSSQDLQLLRQRWTNKNVKFVRSIPFLGYDHESGIYSFPKFAYKDGKKRENNEYDYATFNRLSVKNAINDVTVSNKTDDFHEDWFDDFLGAFGYNGLTLLAWWTGTLFAEQIRKKQQSWTFLEYTGAPGAGKSTQIKFMWRLLGIDNYEGFDPMKSTIAGRGREMSKFANLPVVLLEGDREGAGKNNKQKAFDFDELKAFFNFAGNIRTMGVKDGSNNTRTLLFRGGLLITQNAMVQSSKALLSRVVHCHVTQEHFTPQNAVMANRLKEMSVEKLGGYLHAILSREKELLNEYFLNYEKIRLLFEAWNNNSNGIVKEIRLRENHAQLGAWCVTLRKVFKTKLTADIVDNELKFLWSRAIDRQEHLQSESTVIEHFWEVYNYLQNRNSEMGVSKNILNHHAKPSKFIAINMPHLEVVAGNNKIDLGDKDDLINQLKNSRAYKFVAKKNVRSTIFEKVLPCYIFEAPPEEFNQED